MSYLQLATVGLGGVFVVVGFVIPASGQYLIPAGVGLIGLAIPAFSKKGG